METHASINQIIDRNELGRENPKRAIDQKVTTFGSAVKRKRLMDVTNTVGSSRMVISKEASCGITKECIAQLKEDNAKLLMAIAERNKIIELSSVELQKLRFTVEKSYQQNRMFAQANSQMLAELTSMKERLKTMQHELGCTVAVLRMKNLALDEKEKLNKELSEKIRTGEEHGNNAEDTTVIRPTQLVSNSTNPQSYEKELNHEFCENTRAEEHSTCVEVATGASISYSDTNSRVSNANRGTLRKKNAGSTTLNHQTVKKTDIEPEKVIAEERLKKESSEKKKDAKEELSKCAEVGTDTSKCHTVDSNMDCETNRRRTLRSHSLGAAATIRHKMETKEKDTTTEKVIRRSSRRSSNNNMTSQEQETKEEDPVQAKPSITVNPQVEAEEKDHTRTRKSSRRKSNNRITEQCESKDHFPCSPVAEPSNEENPDQENPSARSNSDTSLKHEKSKNQTSTSQCEEGQEVRRTSMRPTRRAVEKVSSYKEIPLKVKMRRVE